MGLIKVLLVAMTVTVCSARRTQSQHKSKKIVSDSSQADRVGKGDGLANAVQDSGTLSLKQDSGTHSLKHVKDSRSHSLAQVKDSIKQVKEEWEKGTRIQKVERALGALKKGVSKKAAKKGWGFKKKSGSSETTKIMNPMHADLPPGAKLEHTVAKPNPSSDYNLPDGATLERTSAKPDPSSEYNKPNSSSDSEAGSQEPASEDDEEVDVRFSPSELVHKRRRVDLNFARMRSLKENPIGEPGAGSLFLQEVEKDWKELEEIDVKLKELEADTSGLSEKKIDLYFVIGCSWSCDNDKGDQALANWNQLKTWVMHIADQFLMGPENMRASVVHWTPQKAEKRCYVTESHKDLMECLENVPHIVGRVGMLQKALKTVNKDLKSNLQESTGRPTYVIVVEDERHHQNSVQQARNIEEVCKVPKDEGCVISAVHGDGGPDAWKYKKDARDLASNNDTYVEAEDIEDLDMNSWKVLEHIDPSVPENNFPAEIHTKAPPAEEPKKEKVEKKAKEEDDEGEGSMFGGTFDEGEYEYDYPEEDDEDSGGMFGNTFDDEYHYTYTTTTSEAPSDDE
jgi:hypothetical protein